jgi:hypothetical protein
MLRINPPGKVLKEMSAEEMARTPVLLGLDIEKSAAGVFKIFIEIVFQSIRLERLFGQGNWYIGANQVDLKLWATGANITDYTQATTVTVTYTVIKSKKRATGAKIKPEVKGPLDTSASIGEIGVKLEKGEELQTMYSGTENELSVTKANDVVQWEKSMPHGGKIIRDYLHGNLSLWADCTWANGQDKTGEVDLYTFPSLFDNDRKMYSRGKSILMKWILYYNEKVLENESGIKVQFEIK